MIEIHTNDLNDFYSKLLKFSKGRITPLWYRGDKDHTYFGEPSAYRSESYIESTTLEEETIATCRSEMSHFSEVSKLRNNIDWLCYMQHVGVPTRLLDWSFDINVALYFAFEDYTTDSIDRTKFPSLWCIDISKFSEEYAKVLSKQFKTQSIDKEIKNIVIPILKKSLSIGPHSLISGEGADDKEVEAAKHIDNAYIPFVSKIVNERIKMQGGCFIRFPLFKSENSPDTRKKRFEEHRLETFCKVNRILSKTIRRFIFIRPELTFSQLAILNFKTSRVYPEVLQVASSIKKRLL